MKCPTQECNIQIGPPARGGLYLHLCNPPSSVSAMPQQKGHTGNSSPRLRLIVTHWEG